MGAELSDGLLVGVIVGRDVGKNDGIAEGALDSVGTLLGKTDGIVEGSPESVGTLLGENDDCVGSSVVIGYNVCDGDVVTTNTNEKNRGQKFQSHLIMSLSVGH